MVTNIGISEIPLMGKEVLKTALINTFERFGDILNIGVSKCADSDWFTGRGFATLNRNKSKEVTYTAELGPSSGTCKFSKSITERRLVSN
ncbi:uncharacterized protein B0P05DRAFT_538783, partial [Gilbertella persicaria]|uniref:uncharacterized protein n=1 Tax=Gilbertella persicaria TaxID=101096 RepID=UPI00221FD04F